MGLEVLKILGQYLDELLSSLLQRTAVRGLAIAAIIFGLPTFILVTFTGLFNLGSVARAGSALAGLFVFAVGIGALVAPSTILAELIDARKLHRNGFLNPKEYQEVKFDIMRKSNRPGLLRFLDWVDRKEVGPEMEQCRAKMRSLVDEYSPPDPDSADTTDK